MFFSSCPSWFGFDNTYFHEMIRGICGSGRKEGNTGALVAEVLRGTASETELVWLIDLNICYCTGCMSCTFAEMRLIGKLGAVAGMQDVRELKNCMNEARELGLAMKGCLGKASGG